MNVEERPRNPRTEGTLKRMIRWTDLPPTQAGLAEALRRAFDVPTNDNARQFDELLRRLA